MISLFSTVFVFGVLVFIHEFGHFIVAKKNGIRVEQFSFGFGPKLFSKKVGDTEYLLSLIPLGGYIKMAGDEPGKKRKKKPWEFLSKSCGQRAQVIVAGPALNYLLAFILFSLTFLVGAPALTTRVGGVLDDYPAKKARIQENDLILKVDGQDVKYWDEMASIIHKKTEGEIVLDIKRDDKLIKISVSPKIEEHQDVFGQNVKIALVGISPSDEATEVKYGLLQSFHHGGKKLISFTGLTLKSLWYVLTRKLSFKQSFAGPIFIFKLTGSAAKLGFIYVLNLMAHLSMALAIFNVLPIPVLDGGHLFFIAIEKIRKKPLSVRTQEIATQTGMLLLITLLIFVSYFDMVRVGWIDKAKSVFSRTTTQND